MLTINVKKLADNAIIPTYAHDGDAALDLYATESVTIFAGTSESVGTGLSIAIPRYYIGLICPRSGLALNRKVTVLNSPGIIDYGYTGEIRVILQSHGDSLIINPGDRIAQLLVIPRPQILFNIVSELPTSDRGDNGFGSTGV